MKAVNAPSNIRASYKLMHFTSTVYKASQRNEVGRNAFYLRQRERSLLYNDFVGACSHRRVLSFLSLQMQVESDGLPLARTHQK